MHNQELSGRLDSIRTGPLAVKSDLPGGFFWRERGSRGFPRKPRFPKSRGFFLTGDCVGVAFFDRAQLRLNLAKSNLSLTA